MTRLRLIWKVFLAFLVVILLCLGTITWLVPAKVRGPFLEDQVANLLDLARIVETQTLESIRGQSPPDEADQLVKTIGRRTRIQVSILLTDGRILARSGLHADASGRQLQHQPEVREALQGHIAWAQRPHPQRRVDMLHVAKPVIQNDHPIAVVVCSRSLSVMDQAYAALAKALRTTSLLVGGAAIALSFLLARRFSQPLEVIRQVTEQYARGDFSGKLHLSGAREMQELADSVNRMAHQLDRRIREITIQRNEREAILESMHEGVMALDLNDRIMLLNRTGENVLDLNADRVVGRVFQEVLRNAQLQRFLRNLLQDPPSSPTQAYIEIDGRILQLRAALLLNENQERLGLLIMLNDMTRIHKLENLRREFVANVSHELRTPITSVKGFIETLKDGAIEDPAHARRFLDIIDRQINRLNAIIEDLMTLSRIEREGDVKAIDAHPISLRSSLEHLIQQFAEPLAQQQIDFAFECPPDLRVRANGRLLEQALGNLLDNAIKYTGTNGRIRIRVERRSDERAVLIHVSDTGPGIQAEHADRIFERFYRIDRARSRQLGGTGLGLAIVKHIVQAHNGTVRLQSVPGQGSTFTLTLPDVPPLPHQSEPAPAEA